MEMLLHTLLNLRQLTGLPTFLGMLRLVATSRGLVALLGIIIPRHGLLALSLLLKFLSRLLRRGTLGTLEGFLACVDVGSCARWFAAFAVFGLGRAALLLIGCGALLVEPGRATGDWLCGADFGSGSGGGGGAGIFGIDGCELGRWV
jgi:hypothetical protein